MPEDKREVGEVISKDRLFKGKQTSFVGDISVFVYEVAERIDDGVVVVSEPPLAQFFVAHKNWISISVSGKITRHVVRIELAEVKDLGNLSVRGQFNHPEYLVSQAIYNVAFAIDEISSLIDFSSLLIPESASWRIFLKQGSAAFGVSFHVSDHLFDVEPCSIIVHQFREVTCVLVQLVSVKDLSTFCCNDMLAIFITDKEAVLVH